MDKIDRLLEAMENPERHTSAEIEAMLQDPEVKEAFDMLDKMKSSLQSIDTPDVEDEWKAFENKHRQSDTSRLYWITRLLSKNIAASIAIGIASVTAVAAIVGVEIHRISTNHSVTVQEVEMTTGTGIATTHQDTVISSKAEPKATPGTVVFEDETLEAIMIRIAAYYDYKVIFNNNAAKSIRLYFRWNQALPIEDIVESLNNFEQITLSVNDETIKTD